MQRGLIALLIVLGVGLLFYATTAPKQSANPMPPVNQAPAPQAAPHVTALQEKSMKEQVLKNDVDLTEKMCRKDCTNHVKMMLHKMDKATPAQIKAYADKMQKDHKHLAYLIWMDNTTRKQYTYGKIPDSMEPEAKKALQEHILTAKDKVKKRELYQSSPVLKGNKKFLVLGIPSESGKKGMVGIVDQEILNTVTKHQKRNLRLIPYPHDQKYRVKTVDNDDMKSKRATKGEDNGDTSHYYTNEVVVRFKKELSTQQLEKIKQDIHCKHVRHAGYAYIFRSNSMSAEALTSYFKNYDPVYVEPHFLYMTNEVKTKSDPADAAAEQPNDSLYKEYQWNLPIIETNKGWHVSKGNKEVIVGVVDTGVDLTHPDLKGQLLKGYNAIDPTKPPSDDVGHGTHVAGIIGALVNNGEGVAGMTWYNKILPVKVLDDSGAGTSYSVAQGIIWAADHGAKVINMSLGNYAEASFLHDAVKYAYDKDVVLVAATGNDNTNQPGYPAAYPEVFAVSATTKSKDKASFSNYGDYVDVVAPGENIASTYMDNQYAALSGTSMACPHVSALAALIRSVNPNLKNTEVMDIMRNNVIDLGPAGRDNYFGYGQIDVVKALEAADQQQGTLNFFPYLLKKQMDRAASRYK